ncbi:MAG: methyltransferase domain-containing protein [Rhodanobacter sp.]
MRKLSPGDMYVQASLRGLQDAQVHALLPQLQRCAGSHGLLLSAGGDGPPALPLLACWAHMYVDGERYAGDVVATPFEPLPFVDDAFELVWLRHALEVVDAPHQVLGEAMRVLAPGGTLVVAGMHPVSAWSPWFYWMTRGQPRRRLLAPMTLRHLLRQGGMELASQRRVGSIWPSVPPRPRSAGGCCGGSYVLVATKRRAALTPLRLRAAPLSMAANARLAPSPGAHRSGTS